MKNTLIVLLIAIVVFLGGYLIWGVPKSEAPQNTTETNTSLSGILPVTDKNVLDLSGKGLTKVPMDIFDKTNIEELNLSNNQLEGAMPSQIQKMQNLKVLNLSNNKFTGVPAEVGQLKKLEVLNLSNNILTGLPYELGNLSNLKVLDLSGNNYAQQDLDIIKDKLSSSVVIKTD